MTNRTFWALVLSFSIYLLPVFTPHAGLIFWPMMFFSDLRDGLIMALAAAGGALLLQGLAALTFWLLLRQIRWWRLLTMAITLPMLFFTVNFTFLYAIPALVLIAPDWSSDLGHLKRACMAANWSLLPVKAGVSLSLEEKRIAWVRDSEWTSDGILTMPGCQVKPVEFLRAKGAQLISVNGAGERLFVTSAPKYFYSPPNSIEFRELAPPTTVRYWTPLLTKSGSELAWLERGAAAGTPQRPHTIRLRALGLDGSERSIEIDQPQRHSLTLLEADPPLFTLARHRNEILVIDETGSLIGDPVSPEGVYNAAYGFRRVGSEGWVAWDGYREQGKSRIVWSLVTGSGKVIIPRGRSIHSVAVSPDGRHIAFATEANSYFNASGRLVLLRTSDSSILYRRRLAQFARIHLAFLGNNFLAMRSLEGSGNGVAVYHVPDRKP